MVPILVLGQKVMGMPSSSTEMLAPGLQLPGSKEARAIKFFVAQPASTTVMRDAWDNFSLFYPLTNNSETTNKNY